MRKSLAYASVILALLAGPASAETVRLGSVKDNTLYFSFMGETSNGAGDHFFAGTNNENEPRRGLVQFDVASAVPPGATITGVTLTLYMSRTIYGPVDMSLHRVRSLWGEADSHADGEEGGGAPSQPGDATWLHAFYPDQDWPNGAGGDFVPAASAATSVGAVGYYSWSGSGLIADVQAWVDAPAGEFGWLLLGDERLTRTAKRFDTRENPNADFRPVLEVEYVPEPTGLVSCLVLGIWVLRGLANSE